MALIGRSKHGIPGRKASETAGMEFSEVIASIEASVENIRDTNLPHWKYRQILRDPRRANEDAKDGGIVVPFRR